MSYYLLSVLTFNMLFALVNEEVLRHQFFVFYGQTARIQQPNQRTAPAGGLTLE